MDQRYTENDQRNTVTSQNANYLYPILDPPPPDEPATDSEYRFKRNETEEQLRKYWNLPRITPTRYKSANSDNFTLDGENHPGDTVYIIQAVDDNTEANMNEIETQQNVGVTDTGCEILGSTVLNVEPQLGYVGANYITSIMADYCFDDKYLGVTLREYFIYAIFYACLLFVALYTNDCMIFEHNNTIKKALGITLTDGNYTFSFNDLSTPHQIWQFLHIWLNKRLLLDMNMYNKYRCGKESSEEPVLLASPRLTQVRVRATECSEGNNSLCYGPWSKENEETAPFGLKEKPGWVYTPDFNLDHSGRLNRYYGGGYGAHLGCEDHFHRIYNSTALELEECLDGDKDLAGKPGNTMPGAWIDIQTSAVFLEYNTYSASTNLLTFVSLIFEIHAKGHVLTSSHIWTYQLFRTSSVLDFLVLGLEVFILLMLLFYTKERITEFLYFRSKFFCSIYAIIELLLVLAGLAFYILNFVRTRIIRRELLTYVDMVCRGDFYPTKDLLHIKKWIVAADMAFGIFVLLATIKLIKFLTIFESFAKIVFLAKKGFCSIFLLLFIFNVIIMAFGAFGHLLFCDVSLPFKSLCSSIVASYGMLVGSMDYKSLIRPCSGFSPLVFILLYYITVLIFGVNFLKAVAIQSYADSICFYRANCIRRCRFGCSLPFGKPKLCSQPFACSPSDRPVSDTPVSDTPASDAPASAARMPDSPTQNQSSCGDPDLMLSSNTCCGIIRGPSNPSCKTPSQ